VLFVFSFIMFKNQKVLRAPGLRSACAVACGVMLSGLVPGVARADDQLGALVVTATRTPQLVGKVLADVSVIGREAIERQGAGSVADVLRNVQGIEFTRNGDGASTTSVMIRGSNSRHVLVLIDGVPFDSQSSGGATWEAIPLQWVDRIEVVRGPASVAYGSGAMGGVVQIFTRKGKGAPHIEAGLGLSDLGLANGDFSLMGAVGDWDYAVGVAAESSDGFSSRADASPATVAGDRDGHVSNSSHLKLGWRPVADQQVQLSLTTSHLNTMYDASRTSSKDDRAYKDSNEAGLSWSARWLPQWRTVTALGQTNDAYETRGSGVYRTSTRIQTASVLNHVQLDEHAVRFTVERREDHLLNSDLVVQPTGKRGDQVDNGLGLGYEWQGEQAAVSVTHRLDDSDRFGAHRTGALAGSVTLVPGLRLRASTGTAFRAPTIYQQYSRYGDPSLQPESSRTNELALTHEHNGLNLGATVFRTVYDNLIDFGAIGTCLDTSAGCYRNMAHARIQGLSLTADTQVNEVRLTASADYLSPRNTDTGKLLQRRAQRVAKVRAEWTWAEWALGAQAQGVGKRYDDAANAKPLGGYALYGLDASRRLTPESSLVVKVDNLSNHAYQTALNYGQAPRSVFIGWRWAPAH
jgi:vitamin B12 transporter